jgi:RNA polymerase sigma factor (sigma-70 family)
MPGDPFRIVLCHVHRIAGPPSGLSDEHLLARFIAHRDEPAFELLLRRHGGMVLSLCRRLSRQEQDAEDAFQATFLTLARKAASISRRAALGSWLYKVAYRAALATRERTARRTAVEVPLLDLPARPTVGVADSQDLAPILDAEIDRLPERYRVPFVLCYLEGKTLAEAAQALGRPRATIGTWLARARQRLRSRLTSRGIGLSAAFTVLLASHTAGASLPRSLVGTTVAAALGSGSIPAPVLTLTEGVIHAMLISKLKVIAAALLVVVTLGSGVGGLTYGRYAVAGTDPVARPIADSQPPRLSLRGWGTATDPDGDCKFTVAQDTLTITLPGTDHALCVEQNRMNAPRVLRPVEGDFIAQVRVAGDFPGGSKSVVATRHAFHGAGLLVWQDANTYIRLERGLVTSDDQNINYASWELRKGGEFARIGNSGDLILQDAAVWLRIERLGNKILGSVSTDGTSWTTLEPITVDMPKKLLVGVVAGHNTLTGYEPTFEDFRLFQLVEDR